MNLPVLKILPEIKTGLADERSVIVKAPPGVGKTTSVPPELLGESWLDGRKIVVLEPRRLAARSAAYRIADMISEPVGRTVGYRTRTDSRISRETRIEFITEGIFTRQILHDPGLKNIGLVIFDEFHERNIHSDLGLALALDVQSSVREDLRILLMSATLDPVKISHLFDNVAVATCEGRSFEVTTEYIPKAPSERLESIVVKALKKAIADETGSILVFLPGTGEIHRVEDKIVSEINPDENLIICPLYGDLDKKAQDEAIRPAPLGKRKIVLATSIAESSITIDGISVVIDSGLSRKSVFDPRNGMSHLETVRSSRSSSDQRRGRAGRTCLGKCYRLWSENENLMMPESDVPEILESDLADFALALADWGGVQSISSLKWLDVPPAAKFEQAVELLVELGAVDDKGKITLLGRKMLSAGTHPRLANMILHGDKIGFGTLASELAAIIEERDIMKFKVGERNSDLRLRISELRRNSGEYHIDSAIRHRIENFSGEFRRRLGIEYEKDNPDNSGIVLGFAYPDRIAKRRQGNEPLYLLSCGRAAKFANMEPLSREEFITVAELDDREKDARILLAAPLTRKELEQHFGEKIKLVENVEWNDRTGSVDVVGRKMFGKIILDEYPLKNPEKGKIADAVMEGIRKRGLSALPWTDESENLRKRMELASKFDKNGSWPVLTDNVLLEKLKEWLSPFLGGIRRLDDFKKINLHEALASVLDWKHRELLDKIAPTHIKVPSGSNLRLNYMDGEVPVLAVRVQELFGARHHLCIMGGKIPVLIKILSPSMRPVQSTSDLPGFWRTSYEFVKKDLKGRYPKHYWSDNPMEVEATRGLKPRK